MGTLLLFSQEEKNVLFFFHGGCCCSAPPLLPPFALPALKNAVMSRMKKYGNSQWFYQFKGGRGLLMSRFIYFSMYRRNSCTHQHQFCIPQRLTLVCFFFPFMSIGSGPALGSLASVCLCPALVCCVNVSDGARTTREEETQLDF